MQKKVLFTASTFSHILNFHLPYMRQFQQLGWQVDVACGGTPPASLPEASGVIHIPFEKSMTAPKNAAAVRLLRRQIRKESYDLISCHTSLASFFVRLAVMGMTRRPLVACTCHGYLFDDRTPRMKRFVLASAERLTAPVTDLLMTMNEWDDVYASSHRLGKEIVKIPGMGVDFSRFSRYSNQEGAALRAELGFSPEHFLVVYGAEFSPRKSQADLIRSLSRLPDHVVLLLPGTGALWEQCIALARSLGVERRVVFPGQVSDMPLWYAAADAAVSSSRSEGLPFNIMEAMYRGLPVIASDVKGNSDLIRDGESGLLFPYGDAQGCAAQIRRVCEDRELARRLGQTAHEQVRQYALLEVLPQVMAQYAALLPLEEDGRGAVPAPERETVRR